MAECNSYETNNNITMYPNLNPSLTNKQQFRLNKINEIRDYFVAEINERELMSKRLSKYIAFLNYFDKSLIVMSVTTGSISIASFATVIGAPVGIISASFSLAFSISTGLIKILLKTTRNKKKKHNKIVMLERSKLNSIENKISEALKIMKLIMKILQQLLMKKKKYRELKESIRIINSQRTDAEKKNLIEEGKKVGIS